MSAKYVYHKVKDEFWFELLAPNGQRLFKSKEYASFASMENGIESCKKYCTTNIVEKYFPKLKDISCLEYLLGLIEKGEDFNILYNSNHCIGVSDNGIFEKNSHAFKNDLLNGFCIGGSDRYLKLHENYSFQQICDTFNLDNHYSTILKQYYGKRSNS